MEWRDSLSRISYHIFLKNPLPGSDLRKFINSWLHITEHKFSEKWVQKFIYQGTCFYQKHPAGELIFYQEGVPFKYEFLTLSEDFLINDYLNTLNVLKLHIFLNGMIFPITENFKLFLLVRKCYVEINWEFVAGSVIQAK